ncbi:sigma 54-interacting transcriptional regulator [Candidatus Desulfovibrio trichonymphae]|uniref:Sigma 54 interacting domain-containing transmembrane protein n=1 Tax=Candidatus Desulfovibrio trichonymphae TaxID=1725232 RepID=A0A1J1DZ98_9BACT|nr:sigma 54-interacting transcriptional regulator [Candidatus Desulfovibrio trichonymphae]BAV92470.1 sigma 54 interacting domain-containing transmembrane protein [Candidatus Desulfovibrio trichonymphae]GHU97530.1 membrane protein [Deltaproteobacteria bacterium]
MRIFLPVIAGNSLKTASLFVNRSILSQMLLLGLPLLAFVLLLLFYTNGRIVENIVNHTVARNAQFQTRIMALALEQLLAEARNHLLILAAGALDKQSMVRRLKLQIRSSNFHYREIAFIGLAPENKYLLLNYMGDIITVPPDVTMRTLSGPFHNVGSARLPGRVNVGQPLEVSYAFVPVSNSVQSLTFHVLRFSTPVHDAKGNFQGVLALSLDLAAMRDVVSAFSSDGAAGDGKESTNVRSLFFDRDGWMLFQSEKPNVEQRETPLSSDTVRAGFRGDFGRPGFSQAFRPAPDYLNYWDMVINVQNRRVGRISLPETGALWGDGQLRVEGVNYVPVTTPADTDDERNVIGGLAVLDSSFTATRTGTQLFSVYAFCFFGGMLLLGICLARITRAADKQLHALAVELQSRNEQNRDDPLVLPLLLPALEKIKGASNILLERLHGAMEHRLFRQAEATALSQREPVEDLPEPGNVPSHGLVGFSAVVQSLKSQVQKAAQVKADVLIVGETGTGKELVAEAIHQASERADGPFIAINCGALDEALLMDTLFGHVQGAFTEAKHPRKGAFLAAEGGTLLLDEVGNATPKVQQALLRTLATRRIRPLGADYDVPFDTRILAATNAELTGENTGGTFREDLYYRLAVITIRTPSLRNRKEDIPALLMHFLAEAVTARRPGMSRTIPKISRGALARLMRYDWPGNVRELKNILTNALTFCEKNLILAENIPIESGDDAPAMSHEGGEWYADKPGLAAAQRAQDNDWGKKFVQLNPRQKEILPRIMSLGSVSRQEYRALAGDNISVRTALYDLQAFVRLGIVRKEGRGPALRYLVVSSGDALDRAKGYTV